MNIKVADMGYWEEIRWFGDVKVEENLLSHKDEKYESEELLFVLQETQLKSQIEDALVWWRNKMGFSIQSF